MSSLLLFVVVIYFVSNMPSLRLDTIDICIQQLPTSVVSYLFLLRGIF